MSRLTELIRLRARVERDIDDELRRLAGMRATTRRVRAGLGNERTAEQRLELNPQQVRAWAQEQDWPCSPMGRLPKALLEAYADAHPQEDSP